MILKRILWVVLIGICLCVLSVAMVVLREPKPVISGPLKMPDGEVVRIMAVTYGTNHIVGGTLARIVARMPAGPQYLIRRLVGTRATPQASRTTAQPTMVVWLRRATNGPSSGVNSGYLTAMLCDTSQFCSGEEAFIHGWWSNPQDLQFRVFPRRERSMALNFFYHSPTGGVVRCGSLPFANPVFADYPPWQAEPLPVTHTVGNVEATLEKLSTGHDEHTAYKSTKGGGRVIEFGTNRFGERNTTVCAVKLRPLADTNEVWVVANEEVSDATGNKAGNSSMGWGDARDGYFTFAPGLWPTEAAWKVRCEIKRTAGFHNGEKFVLGPVPLGNLNETNRIGWTTNVSGLGITLDQIVRRPPNTNNTWSSKDLSEFQLTVAGLTNGVHLDFLFARTDTGTNVSPSSWSSGGNLRNYSLRNLPLDAKTMEFVFAVQRSQWVEFIAKPEIGPLTLTISKARN